MNEALKAYRRKNRQTPAMRLTDEINAQVTPQNAEAFNNTIDQLTFCADCLGVSLQSFSGERAAIRLENKLTQAARNIK